MSNYTKTTDFAAKDSLLSGNALKIINGTEINTEFNAIQAAVNSKADYNSPCFFNRYAYCTYSTLLGLILHS